MNPSFTGSPADAAFDAMAPHTGSRPAACHVPDGARRGPRRMPLPAIAFERVDRNVPPALGDGRGIAECHRPTLGEARHQIAIAGLREQLLTNRRGRPGAVASSSAVRRRASFSVNAGNGVCSPRTNSVASSRFHSGSAAAAHRASSGTASVAGLLRGRVNHRGRADAPLHRPFHSSPPPRSSKVT